MRTRIGLFLFGLATLAIGLPSCDDLNVGRLPDDPDAPTVTRILVQDANSGVVTDLLNDSMPLACSDINPCPVGTTGLSPTICDIPPGETEGKCDNPTSNSNIISVGDGGSLQVRIIISKSLDPGPITGPGAVGPGGVEEVTLKDGKKVYKLVDPTAAQLIGPDGKPVADVSVYYTPSGSNWDTADPFGEPLGPALVIDILAPLEFAGSYSVKINGTSLKDKGGKAITDTFVNNKKTPLNSAGYTFKTEPVAAAGSTPDITSAPTMAPNDIIQVEYTGPVDGKTFKTEVKDKDGKIVAAAATEAWNDLDDKCMGDPVLVDIFVAGGSAKRWPEGTFKITITGKDASGHDVTPLEGDFTVKAPDAMDDNAIDKHLPPAECTQPMPDML